MTITGTIQGRTYRFFDEALATICEAIALMLEGLHK